MEEWKIGNLNTWVYLATENSHITYCDVFLSLPAYHVDTVSHIKSLDKIGNTGRGKKGTSYFPLFL